MTRSISYMAFATSLALLAFTNASTHIVAVGNGGLKFTPNSTIALVGDVVEFHYYPRNHSVTQGDFSNPCMSTSGFFSGYMPTASGEAPHTFSVTINDANPIYFYCSQPGLGGHCAQGMVGCVNCPTSGNSLAAYAMGAMNTTNATVTHPTAIGGGIIAANTNATTAPNATATGTATGTTSTSTPSVVTTNAGSALAVIKWSEISLGITVAIAASLL
ncbi:hypothetical protein BP5796_06774 [Coleophoma crateriformis]|uniref:Phytocyanin domain-containing protein n=1 Tax=Coleophoma crateriformis TaxID=565419 RepID=A0A3D8RPH1_9HELO|nr:hypothetical protein BP5796_06774 [Coleophoma crateriformis]